MIFTSVSQNNEEIISAEALIVSTVIIVLILFISIISYIVNSKLQPVEETIIIEESPRYFNLKKSPRVIQKDVFIVKDESPRFVFKKAEDSSYVSSAIENRIEFKNKFREFSMSIQQLRADILDSNNKRSFVEKRKAFASLENRVKGINQSLEEMIQLENSSVKNSTLKKLLRSTIEETKTILKNWKQIRQEYNKNNENSEAIISNLAKKILYSRFQYYSNEIISFLNKY